MSRSRFVTASTTRIDLSEGDWIEVRDRLPFGKQQKLASAGIGGVSGFDGTTDLSHVQIGLDMGAFEIERIMAWMTDWSFRDDRDKVVAFSRSAVENLDSGIADEIRAALDAHISRIEDEKKARAGTNGVVSASLS